MVCGEKSEPLATHMDSAGREPFVIQVPAENTGRRPWFGGMPVKR